LGAVSSSWSFLRRHWLLWLLLAIAAAACYRVADHTLLLVRGEFPDGYLTVYWAGKHQQYSDARSRVYATNPGRQVYVFLLPGPRELRRLRLDPPEHAPGTIDRLAMFEFGRRIIEQSPGNGFDKVAPLFETRLQADTAHGLTYVPEGPDPQLVWKFPHRRSGEATALAAGLFLLVMGAVALAYGALRRYATNRGLTAAQALVSPPVWLAGTMLFAAVYYVWQTPFHEVLRKDAVYYLLTGIRMTFGDIIPLHQHNTGWPMVLAAGLEITGIRDYPRAMVMARALSDTLVILWLVPFYVLCRRLCTDNATRIGLVAMVLTPYAAAHSHHALSEPLYVFLSLFAFILMLGAEGKPGRTLMAAMACGLASYARPDGLFLLGPVLLIAAWSAWKDRKQLYVVFLVPVVFFATAIFHLLPRYLAFGSPFDYGENSKYFVEGYRQVWAPNIHAPTIWQYLSTHSFAEIWQKFFNDGFLHVLWSIHVLPGEGSFLVWPYLAYAGLIWFVVLGHDRRLLIFVLAALAYIVGLTPVAQVYDDPGHCIVLLAPLILIGAKWLGAVIDRLPHAALRGLAVVAVIAGLWVNAHFHPQVTLRNMHWPYATDEWARWAAANLEGKVAIVEGGDLIDILQPWDKLGRFNLMSDEEKAHVIQPFRPGIYPDWPTALAEFRRDNVRYLLVDPFHCRSRPYMLGLLEPGEHPGVTRIASFDMPPDAGWEIEHMAVFRVEPASR